ncbi:MAG: coproporphyrinogen-III oxidase family protein [Thermoanaerobaculia bacterium]
MSQPEPATTPLEVAATGVGSVFVSNYPPFSFWNGDCLPAVDRALDLPGDPATPLGLYLHIPFCRKRCKFCYFRVYTDKNASEIGRYIDVLEREADLYAARPALTGRSPGFVYFGGGTPSFISVKHLDRLVGRLRDTFDWDGSLQEFTFECEPGTLTRTRLEAIRRAGVTRLSLGVEHFNDEVLSENGRAHLSAEIYEVMPWIRELEFPVLNIDLIAGMVGDSEASWRDTVERTIDLDADCVTIYQMELPFNAVYSAQVQAGGLDRELADWPTKRDWHRWAVERLEQAGYEVSSAYTMVKRDAGVRFVYRDALWHGADLIGLGVSSFSHLAGLHYQNSSEWNYYVGRLEAGELPLARAYTATPRERLVREMILQLKLGRIGQSYFAEKFGVAILDEFAEPFARLEDEGMLRRRDGAVELTREGLLQVDFLLTSFYDEPFVGGRYT